MTMLRSFWQSFSKKTGRVLAMSLAVFKPAAEKRTRERWLRGREQFDKLQKCDCAVVSYGKSGRTWLRVMMSRFYEVKHALPSGQLLNYDNFHHLNKDVPIVFFTHDNYTKDFTGNYNNKSDYRGTKVVLLVRHPGDVAVSQYFQWRYRMKPKKMWLNDFPEPGTDVPIYDFMMNEPVGLQKAIDFLNDWVDALRTFDSILLVRYEDMRRDPAAVLARILAFVGTPGTSGEIEEAVRFASVDNMRALERKRAFWLSGGRLQARDVSNPDSFKVRRAKVGGYRDYVDAEQARAIDARIAERLAPDFGYGIGDDAPAAARSIATAGR